jgi:hypothetical protein
MPGVELGNKEELAPVQVLDGFANQAFSPPFPIHFSGVDYVDPGRQAIPYGRDFLLPPAGIFPHVPGAQAQLAQFFPFDGHVFHALASIYFLFFCFALFFLFFLPSKHSTRATIFWKKALRFCQDLLVYTLTKKPYGTRMDYTNMSELKNKES